MHLYRANVLKPTQVEGHIIGLEPKIFNTHVPNEALEASEIAPKDFQLNELTVEHTGLSDVHKKNVDDKVNQEVLNKLKEVQEKAYAEGHTLGLEDGKKQAFQAHSENIDQSLGRLNEVLNLFEGFKKQMFVENEQTLVSLVFFIAKNIILKEIKNDPSVIVEVLKVAIEDANSDEEIIIRINKDDFDFIQTVTDGKNRIWENSKKIKFEVSDFISRGGCILETSHGIIDAQIEKRMNKAWDAIMARAPKLENE